MAINPGLRTFILLPLALVLMALFAMFNYSLNQHERLDSDESFARDLQSAQTYYQHALAERSEKLGVALAVIQHDAQLQAALRAKDRNALLKRTESLFAQFRERYGITHFYFEDVSRVNVLRVHQPGRFGDTINRFTTLAAERTGAIASGVELGPIGTFTLRVVAPMHDEHGLVGYVELGEEIEGVLRGIQAVVGVEYLLLIDKNFLTRKAWEEGMRMLGRNADWDRLSAVAMVHQTLDLPGETLNRVVSGKARPEQPLELTTGSRRYYTGAFPLVDAGGTQVGKMVVLRDRTQNIEEMQATLRSLSQKYVILAGALLLMFYLITTRVQRSLEKSSQDLIAHGLERESLQARHIHELEQERDKLRQARNELQYKESSLSRAQQIARIGSWDWDISGSELRWSDEIYRIFGLRPQEFGATYEAFLMYVHPEDRNRVSQMVDAALAGGRPYEVEHRVVRPDGTERTVLELAEVIRDSTGQAARMYGTVQDVTDSRQAEEDLRLADQVFKNSIEGIIITDAESNILRVNRAFTIITGYSEDDAIGKNPRLLRSDRHDVAFYQAMWASLLGDGYWQGEVWNRRKNGEIYPQWLSIVAIRNEQGKVIHYLGVFADLSEKKQVEAHLHRLSYYDALTELPNRLLLEERLKLALATASHNSSLLAVMHLDLDRFKTINDTLGHPFGDKLLQAVAERLAGDIRGSDTVARFSGDEFAVVLTDVGNQENAALVARKILDALARPFGLDGHEVFITPSIGIAFYPLDAASKDDLIRHADTAMSHAKAQGGNGYRFYSAEMNTRVSQRLSLETSLRYALERNEFLLHYQPQIDLRSGKIIGMEALLRWQHPERGLVSPAEFIPVLEETGLIVPVGEWVLRTACAQNSAWLAAGLPRMRMAVNLSAHQFRQSSLTEMVCLALEDSGLAPELLELEITESIMIQDLQTTLTTLNHLHVIGIQISIDDFGTGYSSLSYLKRLPISKIKIDQSFVRDICADPDDAAIADAVISLGHSLKMQVIAEGVETLEQLDYLRAHGCDEMQGYYFSRPLPAGAFAELVSNKQPAM